MMNSNSVSLHCPFCGRHTAVSVAPLSVPGDVGRRSVLPALGQMLGYDTGGHFWWLGKCNGCEMPLLVCNEGRYVYPTPQAGPVSTYIPDPMRGDLREAKLCLAAGAWNAAVVLARRALQCATVERGAPKGDPLWKQIRWLDDNRKITPEQREWADAARWVGNDGAHGTEPNVAAGQPVIVGVTEEDAKATVELVEHLFETLYVATKRAREQAAKRGKGAKPKGEA